MINKVYSILARGSARNAAYYQRKVDTTAGRGRLAAVGKLLVPDTPEGPYYNYQVEQLVQICRKSRLEALLTAFDPLNTYDTGFEPLEPVTAVDGLPGDVQMALLEPYTTHIWVAKAFTVSYIAPDRFTVNGVAVRAAAGGPVPLADGLAVHFSGDLASPFRLATQFVRQPGRDLAPLLTALESADMPWLDTYSPWRHTTDVNDKLAAVALNYCEVNSD